MKKKIFCLILAACLLTGMAAGCGGNRTSENESGTESLPASSDSLLSGSGSGGSDSGEKLVLPSGPSVPVEENFELDAALASETGWEGIEVNNPVFDTENKFLTFREKSNNSVSYKTKGMSRGDLEMKIKVRINSDTTAYVAFSNQSENLSAFCYDKGSFMYTAEFSSEGKIFVKKWLNGEETVLSGNKSSASVPMSFATRFTPLKISLSEENGRVDIQVYTENSLLLDVTDRENPILGGGAVGLSYTGAGGMAVGGKDSEESAYTEPEKLGINIYSSPDKQTATGEVDLLASFDTVWTGRERIFNVEKDAEGYVFSSKSNPEEPQDGVTEYQAVYTDKIFGDVQLEYTYNQLSNGEWTMFWLRCVPESSPDVSIWGNKKTGENTNGYSVLVTCDGYIQVHKWADGAQIWLNGQGTKLPGSVVAALNDPKQTVDFKASIKKVKLAGKDTVEIRIKVNDASTVVVQDSDTPFLNAGYIGLQGYAVSNTVDAIRLLSAKATDDLNL